MTSEMPANLHSPSVLSFLFRYSRPPPAFPTVTNHFLPTPSSTIPATTHPLPPSPPLQMGAMMAEFNSIKTLGAVAKSASFWPLRNQI